MWRTVLLLLLLAPVLPAQDKPEEALAKAKARLAELEKDGSEEGKRWKSAISKRIALLGEQAATAKERAEPPDADALETRQQEIKAELEELGRRPTETVGIRSIDQLAGYEKRFNELQAEAKPNRSFITQNVVNWTRESEVTRRDIMVTVAYGEDVDHVTRTLKRVVDEHPQVAKQPAPQIRVTALGESGIQFMVCAFVPMSVGISTTTSLHIKVYEALRAEGIRIAYPRQDLRIISDPEPGSP
jgi:hypothetical protein